ncbi:hypothetical protein EXS72_00545, partial [Candidatus Pacearchaeota archaeon]|nr:hypothetical protein [Candidatus Pacearchaeota archaeon]
MVRTIKMNKSTNWWMILAVISLVLLFSNGFGGFCGANSGSYGFGGMMSWMFGNSFGWIFGFLTMII